MTAPSQDTPNDPLFGSTPASIVTKVLDGSYAIEVLDNSDERPVRTERTVAVEASASATQPAQSAPAAQPTTGQSTAPSTTSSSSSTTP